jgi:hypothetical protein
VCLQDSQPYTCILDNDDANNLFPFSHVLIQACTIDVTSNGQVVGYMTLTCIVLKRTGCGVLGLNVYCTENISNICDGTRSGQVVGYLTLTCIILKRTGCGVLGLNVYCTKADRLWGT